MRQWFSWGSFVFTALCSSTSLSLAADQERQSIELFVSPNGNDQFAGTAAQPFATPLAAQQRLRQLRAASSESEAVDVTVWLAEGVYELSAPLEFTEEDTPSAAAHTTFQALPGQRVVLRGGRSIPLSACRPVTDNRWIATPARDHVRVVDLAKLQVDEVGQHSRRARHTSMHPEPLELFSGSQRLPVASWPNSGWATTKEIGPDKLSWTITELRHPNPTAHARAHGFWQHDWQDSCEPVHIRQLTSGTNLTTHQLQIDAAHAEHVGSIRQGARYRVENLLTELDAPGEWYHDTATHLLYVWLPDNSDDETELFVTTLDTPISCYDAQRLTFSGLTIEGARASCVEIAGGSDVSLQSCFIRHAGNLGVNIYHGERHSVSHCEITGTGAGAIRVEGGHRETLAPCEHVIQHNRLHDFAQLHLAYRPGVNVYGVGVKILHNAIYNAPHSAVILHGNEHVIENNEIHHVCLETDDCGAIYLGHNPTFRGNILRHNHIHDLGGFNKTDIMGIYLDDFASGTLVSHNVLERAGRGVAIGGGRDNVVDNNLFVDCLAAVQIDCRGRTWARHYVEGDDAHFVRFCEEVKHDSELFTARYPELASLLTDSPELASGNRIQRNLFEGAIGIDLQDGLDNKIVYLQNNFGEARKLVADLDHGDYQPISGWPSADFGIEAIALNDVGPKESESVPRAVYVSEPVK